MELGNYLEKNHPDAAKKFHQVLDFYDGGEKSFTEIKEFLLTEMDLPDSSEVLGSDAVTSTSNFLYYGK